MTNLLEKALLIGFGIFILTIFFILVAPFFGKITDFKENDKRDLDDDYNNSITIKFHKNNENIDKDVDIYFVNVDILRSLEIFSTNKYIRFYYNPKEKTFKLILKPIEFFLLKSALNSLYLIIMIL